MKILYVAPRFHPNQYPIIEGLIEKGHEVRFCVATVGKTEKHGDIRVEVLKPSWISKIIYNSYSKKSENLAEDKMLKYFIPSFKNVRKIIKEIKPDVVIMREKSFFSLVMNAFGNLYRVKKRIIYNQSPIFYKKQSFLRSSVRKLWGSLFPKERITVCRYSTYPDNKTEYVEDKNAYFLPFVPRKINVTKTEYVKDGIVRILDCGKYRPYKNHFFVVDVIEKLVKDGHTNIFVTIMGQNSNGDEKKYFEKLCKYVSEKNLDEYISVGGSVPYDDMVEIFAKNDIFILASSRELANVSILDSMSIGLATVATNKNGTSDYVEDGYTGMIYESNDVGDLAEKLECYIKNPNLIKDHGENGKKHISDNFSFESYYKKFISVIES